MNIVLWILAGLLALAFVGSGVMKLATPKGTLVEKGMGWANDFGQQAIRGIGAIEVLGAVGLIVPAAVDVAPVLTPIAALCLALTMAGAVVVHLRRGETKESAPALVLGVLVLVLAILRFGPYSF
jgi:hypothetical protein